MALFLVSVTLALVVSAVCSLMEATLLSLTPSQVADISKKEPSAGSIWQRFKTNIQPPIAAILLLNTAAHTIGASVAGSQFAELYGDKWILAFSLAFTFIMLQFTEILPKTLGVRYNREVAGYIAKPLNIVVLALNPFTKAIHFINRPFEGRSLKPERAATIEEITALAGLARLSNQISSYQERIIHGASRLAEISVDKIMIPDSQVSFLSSHQSISDAIIAAHIEAHTRYPVSDGDNRDNILGYVNFKEMIYFMRTNPNDPSFQGIIRPVGFVAPDTSAADLVKGFVTDHVHMSIVRDANGKTLGMVTFEDLVEELVGDLEDEFDRLPRMAHPLSGGTWMVGGGKPMTEVATLLKKSFSEVPENISTWLIGQFGRTPKAGESIKRDGFEFMIRRIRRGQVFEVAVRPLTKPNPPSPVS
jgi:CBS domain containing-hemolysin-like protein